MFHVELRRRLNRSITNKLLRNYCENWVGATLETSEQLQKDDEKSRREENGGKESWFQIMIYSVINTISEEAIWLNPACSLFFIIYNLRKRQKHDIKRAPLNLRSLPRQEKNESRRNGREFAHAIVQKRKYSQTNNRNFLEIVSVTKQIFRKLVKKKIIERILCLLKLCKNSCAVATERIYNFLDVC